MNRSGRIFRLDSEHVIPAHPNGGWPGLGALPADLPGSPASGTGWKMAQEASESRLYAGLHYRFDKEVGLALGRAAAAKALAADLAKVPPLP